MTAKLAPKVRVPATIGRRCTADMVGRRDERFDRRDLVEENTNQGGKASMVYAIDGVSAKRVESLGVSCRHAWLAQKEHETDNSKHLGRGTECACSVVCSRAAYDFKMERGQLST